MCINAKNKQANCKSVVTKKPGVQTTEKQQPKQVRKQKSNKQLARKLATNKLTKQARKLLEYFQLREQEIELAKWMNQPSNRAEK